MNARFILLALLAMSIVISLASCSRKSADQLAAEALDRGLQAHAAGRIDEAAKAYREVLDHDRRNKFAFYNLGVIEQAAGRNMAAENNYRLALSVDPDYTPALYNLAILRATAGAIQEAIDLYRHIITVQPDNASAHLNLGFAFYSIGKQAEGDAEIKRAVELNPSLAAPASSTPNQAPAPRPSPAPTR